MLLGVLLNILQTVPIFQLWSNTGVLQGIVCNDLVSNPIQMYDPECNDYSLRYHNLTDMILHQAAWYEAACFVEREQAWDINEQTRCLLNFQYMTREHIIDLV